MTPVIDINPTAATASLALYSGATPLTQYTYAAGQVTLAARPSPVTLSKVELGKQLGDIEQWIGQVSDGLSPATGALGKFMAKVKRTNTKVKADYEADGVAITDAEYDLSDYEYTFGPRPQHTMTYCDFVRWVRFLRGFERDCA